MTPEELKQAVVQLFCLGIGFYMVVKGLIEIIFGVK